MARYNGFGRHVAYSVRQMPGRCDVILVEALGARDTLLGRAYKVVPFAVIKMSRHRTPPCQTCSMGGATKRCMSKSYRTVRGDRRHNAYGHYRRFTRRLGA